MNKYEDKIYFLEDILDIMEQKGFDREMVRCGFIDWRERLLQDMATTDNISYKVGTLGTLLFPLKHLKYLYAKTLNAQKLAAFTQDQRNIDAMEERLEVVKMKSEEALKRVKKGIKENKYSIPFLRKRKSLKRIKNED